MSDHGWEVVGGNPAPGDPETIRGTANVLSWENLPLGLSIMLLSGYELSLDSVWRDSTDAQAFKTQLGAPLPMFNSVGVALETVQQALTVYAATLESEQVIAEAARVQANKAFDSMVNAQYLLGPLPSINPDPSQVGVQRQLDDARTELALAKATIEQVRTAMAAAQKVCAVKISDATPNAASLQQRLYPAGAPPVATLGGTAAYQAYIESVRAYAAANPPIFPADPAAALAQWKSYDPVLRQAYLDRYPDIIGNTDGIPSAVRSQANMTVVNKIINDDKTAAAAKGMSVEDYFASLNDGTVGSVTFAANAKAQYENAVAVQKAIDNYKDKALASGGLAPPVLLLAFDGTRWDGHGRATISIGDPDTAQDTAVCVPGLRQDVQDHIGSPDPLNLYNQMVNSDKTQTHAVVNWVGYDTPGFDNVASPDAAHNGAKLLASDVAALQTTHSGASRLTVIGHSYGSTTVADAAAQEGMRPDDMVLIGSPGVDSAHTVADLGMPAGHVYAGAASRDAVADLPTEGGGSLGADPADADFGAIRFHAEAINRTASSHEDLWNTPDHSRYFDVTPGLGGVATPSQSLQNISDIATGRGLAPDQVAAPRVTNVETFPQPGVVTRDAEWNYQPQWGDPSK